MSLSVALASLALVLASSFLSGIFGMAGGFILMGGLLLVLPVATAMVVHGIVQFVANFSRAVILRDHIAWPIIAWTTLGTALAVAIMVALRLRPSQTTVFLLLGLMPLFVWIPDTWLKLDARKPLHGLLAGMCSGGFNVGAGVGGPAVDIFFVRTDLDRRVIVAVKSLVQSISHIAKTLYWGFAGASLGLDLAATLALAIPLAIIGTNLGARVLERLSDASFRHYARWIVTGIGAVFLARALVSLLG